MSIDPDPTPQGPSPTARNWALIAHVAGLLAWAFIPFGGILAPMVIWLVKREEDAYIGDQALEAMNFQITVALAALVSAFLLIVGIGVLLLLALWVGNLVLAILAAIAASEGRSYRYPLNLRLVSA